MRLSDKYEPKSVQDMIVGKDTRRRLAACIERPVPVLLHGPPGTGKNTWLNILMSRSPKHPDGQPVWNFHVFSGVEVTADSLKEGGEVTRRCYYGVTKNGYRQYIVINEFEKVREDNQTILRDLVERYQNRTPFIIMLNDINKVDPPLRDRFHVIELGRGIGNDMYRNHLIKIIKQENARVLGKTITNIVNKHKPSIRAMIHELEMEIIMNGGEL